MATKQLPPVGLPTVQEAIYQVALSLDAFLINGIQFGVLQQNSFKGFLQKTAGNLLWALDSLEAQSLPAAANGQVNVKAIITSLRSTCQQVIFFVTELSFFKTYSLEQLGVDVARIPLLREECVQLIQELESALRIERPFYQSRPVESTAAVDDFLTRLPHRFTEAWEIAAATGC